ncbi:unnamed protein product [Symbiodinium microadriaticum]|nr:unnamed protein product [Symbiodinium microadriaticum]
MDCTYLNGFLSPGFLREGRQLALQVTVAESDDRNSNPTGEVSALSLAEWQALKAGGIKAEQYEVDLALLMFGKDSWARAQSRIVQILIEVFTDTPKTERKVSAEGATLSTSSSNAPPLGIFAATEGERFCSAFARMMSDISADRIRRRKNIAAALHNAGYQ